MVNVSFTAGNYRLQKQKKKLLMMVRIKFAEVFRRWYCKFGNFLCHGHATTVDFKNSPNQTLTKVSRYTLSTAPA